MIGQTFGRWTVLGVSQGKRKNGGIYLNCRCVCGTTKPVQKYTLTKGLSASCGCISAERNATRFKKHGGSDKPEYTSWRHMISRCHNKKSDAYKWYGGRGVSVCEEWLNSFEAFVSHIGPRPSMAHSIDRIDPYGNYEPGNVRWATKRTQSVNKRLVAKNKTGHAGVCQFGKKYRAYISVDGKHKHLGLFDTAEAAAAVRRKAFERHYGVTELKLLELTRNQLTEAV